MVVATREIFQIPRRQPQTKKAHRLVCHGLFLRFLGGDAALNLSDRSSKRRYFRTSS